MKYLFITSENVHETVILRALYAWAKKAKHSVIMQPSKDYRGPKVDVDMAVVVGVKGVSKQVMDDYLKVGAHVLYMDKGYVRRKMQHGAMEFYRVSIDAFQPLAYLNNISHNKRRWQQLNITIDPAKEIKNKGRILYAGSSQKYSNFKRLGDATDYAKKVIGRLREYDTHNRKIIYRPKPSWRNATPIEGTIYSGHTMQFAAELARADMLVTHGSNACFEAMLRGVPALVLGDGITKQFSVDGVKNMAALSYPAIGLFRQFCYNLAWQQWRVSEIENGVMGGYIDDVLSGIAK